MEQNSATQERKQGVQSAQQGAQLQPAIPFVFPEHNYWLRTKKQAQLPKVLHASVHVRPSDYSYVLFHFNSQKIQAVILNSVSLAIEEKIVFEHDDAYLPDLNFLHHETIQVCGRVFFFQNSMPREPVHVYFCDFNLKKFYPIRNIDSTPSDFRVNYSVALHAYKILFFGGLNEQLQPINSVDTFDISTYRWERLKPKGAGPSARHSATCFVAKDRLFVIGGTKSTDLFERATNSTHSPNTFIDAYALDIATLTWVNLQICGEIPRHLNYCQALQYQEDKRFLILSRTHSDFAEAYLKSHLFDVDTLEFKELKILNASGTISNASASNSPEARYHAASAYNERHKQLIVCGGFSFQKNESNCICNEIERLQVTNDFDAENFKKIQLYVDEGAVLQQAQQSALQQQANTPVVQKVAAAAAVPFKEVQNNQEIANSKAKDVLQQQQSTSLAAKNLISDVKNIEKKAPPSSSQQLDIESEPDSPELTFEELLAQEKRLEQQEKTKSTAQNKKKNKKKKKKDGAVVQGAKQKQ